MLEIADGNGDSFKILFDRHAGKVLGYSTRLLGGDSNMAEDISQTVWMKVVQNARNYRGEGTFIAWIHTITRNSVFDEMRKKKEELFSENTNDELDIHHLINSSIELSVESIETELLQNSDITIVKQAMDELPDTQRLVLTIWLVEELSYEDIAMRMNQSIQAIKSLLFRARQSLKEKLKGQL